MEDISTDTLQVEKLITMLAEQHKHIIGKVKYASYAQLFEYIINYYEDIINCMPGNVYWLDRNCVTVGCNKNVLDMFGLNSIAEFKGLNFETQGRMGGWPDDAIQAFKKDTAEVIATGKPKLNIEEPPIPHHNGHTIHFLTSRVPLFDHNNNVIGVVGISIDITELKNTQVALKIAKEQAEAASKAKSEFVANMSHDVKTPLAGIIGIAELLTDTATGPHKELAQTLLTSGHQLLNFFDNCLEVFKLENTNIILNSEAFSLKTLLNEIHALFQPALELKKLGFNIHFQPDLPSQVLGSRAGIYRILLNLVGNAVKFTHKGQIDIYVDFYRKKTKPEEILLKLTVIDTGIGIPDYKQQIIFERFTRLIPSYKGTYEGNGIGLYIVQKFISAMSGEIYVKSEEGKGSEFIVLINLKECPEDQCLAPPEKISDVQLDKKNYSTKPSPRILLVEDNLIAQLMERSLFSSLKCEVDVVDHGEKALATFKPGKYDLIVMDIGLPGMQGDTVTKLIREMEQTAHSSIHVPIIALTAHISEKITQYCLASGMQGVYSKPLSREQAQHLLDRYYFQ